MIQTNWWKLYIQLNVKKSVIKLYNNHKVIKLNYRYTMAYISYNVIHHTVICSELWLEKYYIIIILQVVGKVALNNSNKTIYTTILQVTYERNEWAATKY